MLSFQQWCGDFPSYCHKKGFETQTQDMHSKSCCTQCIKIVVVQGRGRGVVERPPSLSLPLTCIHMPPPLIAVIFFTWSLHPQETILTLSKSLIFFILYCSPTNFTLLCWLWRQNLQSLYNREVFVKKHTQIKRKRSQRPLF